MDDRPNNTQKAEEKAPNVIDTRETSPDYNTGPSIEISKFESKRSLAASNRSNSTSLQNIRNTQVTNLYEDTAATLSPMTHIKVNLVTFSEHNISREKSHETMSDETNARSTMQMNPQEQSNSLAITPSTAGLSKSGKIPMFRPMNTILRAKDSPYTDRRKSYAASVSTHPDSSKGGDSNATNVLGYSFKKQSSDSKRPTSMSVSNLFTKFYLAFNIFLEKRLGMNKQFEDKDLYNRYLEHMMGQYKLSWRVTDLFMLGLGLIVGIVAAILLPSMHLTTPSNRSEIISTLVLIAIFLLFIFGNVCTLYYSKSLKIVHIMKTSTLIYFGLMTGLFNIFAEPEFFRSIKFLFYAFNFATVGFPVSRLMYISIGCTAFEFITLLAALGAEGQLKERCLADDSPLFISCGRLFATYIIYLFCVHIVGFLIAFGGDQHNKYSFLKMIEIQNETERYRVAAEEAERIAISVLPRKVWEDLRGSQRGPYRITSIFHEGTILHHYDTVAILFGDIVGFTQLSSKLSASTLVRWLDSIFTQFDDVMDELGLEKIKTIGDCYMVCAGIPNKIDHPEIRMLMAAQKMVAIVERASELKGGRLRIRIGVHTGKAWGGILGEQKLIYDVWSDDVTLAASMENSGKQGMIHVSSAVYEATKDVCEYEQGKRFESEKFCINTYFLKEIKISSTELGNIRARTSTGIKKRKPLDEVARKRESIFKSSNYIAKSMSHVSLDDPEAQKVIEDDENMILNKNTLTWYNLYNDSDLEQSYFESCTRNAPPKMVIMLSASMFLTICLVLMNLIMNQTLASTLTLILVLLFQSFWCYCIAYKLPLFSVFSDKVLYFFYTICFVNSCLLELGILLQTMDNNKLYVDIFVMMNFLIFYLIFLYQRVPYYLIIGLLVIMVPPLMALLFKISYLRGNGYTILILIVVVVIVINSFFFDRRLRLDFLNHKELLRRRMKNEDLRSKTMELLDKLVPLDVVERLKENPNSLIADFYEEAAIMFAEVRFIDDSGKVKTDLQKEQIETLHEIYTIFDRLLLIHHVEKIKSIGFVYLAIAYGEAISADDSVKDLIRAPFYRRLANFALDIKSKIKDFAQKRNLNIELRIGMNVGPIAAGVIGKKKLAYDVWGDAVNIASRMESTQNTDSIQISEAFYKLLQEDYVCDDRGMIPVKGKGDMHLYFLKNKL